MPLPDPPLAERRPHELTFHGDTRVDDWYWLTDRDDASVIAHLEAENAYTEAWTATIAELRDRIFEEIRSRIQETDEQAPVRWGDWRYYGREVEGQEYPIHARRLGDGGEEQVVLDENVEAGGHEFFDLRDATMTLDHRRYAWAADLTGRERCTLRVRDVESGADLPDVIEDVHGSLAWAADGEHLFYVRADEAERPFQVWRHRLGTPAADDALVFQEDDERFFVAVGRSRSGEYLFISTGSAVTSDVRFLRADDPAGEWTVVEPRRQDVEYHVDHHGDVLLIVTNADGAEDFKLVQAPVESPGKANWVDVVPHRPGTRLVDVDAFRDWVVVTERHEALLRLVFRPNDGGEPHVMEQPETVYTAGLGGNPDYDTSLFRVGYMSLVTPRSDIDYDPATGARTIVKQQPVLGGYDPADYETGRLWATAPDGVRVPISYVARRDLPRDGSNPCLLYGYGSYEHSTDPWFSSLRLSLLDRGVVFAIGHVRGGGEMGRRWYEDGKLLAKPNTFSDFRACAEALVGQGLTSRGRIAIRGGSAGGLLVGASANLDPSLFGAVVAEVPFVDALTTILDPSLPLTVVEWEEWGNPIEDPAIYACMKSYAPVDNVAATDYPPMFVTGGLNDPRVGYWEPAKWVQKLRATATNAPLVVLKTELGAGHQGPSGRYQSWKDEALVHAFVLTQLGVETPAG